MRSPRSWSPRSPRTWWTPRSWCCAASRPRGTCSRPGSRRRSTSPQIGGYINLIEDDPVLSAQVLASALGVAGPNPTPGFDPTLPPLFFSTRGNDRPTGAAQAATPVSFRVRNDFAAGARRGARAPCTTWGCCFRCWPPTALLPPLSDAEPPDDLLPFLGRRLTAVPSAALDRPDHRPAGRRAARRRGRRRWRWPGRSTPPPRRPGRSSRRRTALWTCDATTCTQATVTGAYVDLDPVLAAAGWHRPAPLTAPASLGDDKDWNTWQNVTGPGRGGEHVRRRAAAALLARPDRRVERARAAGLGLGRHHVRGPEQPETPDKDERDERRRRPGRGAAARHPAAGGAAPGGRRRTSRPGA